MKNFFSVFLFSLTIFSCQTQTENPLVAKYNVQYEATKRQVIANKSDINGLIQQLPPAYQSAIQKGIIAIEKYDLNEFLQSENMSEEGLLLLFQSIDQFLNNIKATRNFKAKAEQKEMYNLFKSRLEENKRYVDKFIAAGEKSKDPNQLSSALFLEKVMQYDIQEFVQNTFIGKEDFEKTFTEVNENWDEFISNLIVIVGESE